MIINRYNYEVFLIDYLDGKLNSLLASELMLFFEQNPDLKNELEGIEDAVLVPEAIGYPNKIDLKKKSFLKNGIDNEADYITIATIEGVLADDELLNLKSAVDSNNEFEKDLNIYRKTILRPNSEIRFTGKAYLKRATVIPIRYSTLRRTISIAASIGLLIGVYSIAKLLIYEKPNEPVSKSNVAAAGTLPIRPETKLQAVDNNVPIKKSSVQNDRSVALVIVEPNKNDTTSSIENNQRIEFIPLMLAGIKSKDVVLRKNIQYEQIALLIEDYSRQKEIANEYLQISTGNQTAQSNYREIGVFEILQYGVQSLGKFIGRDIRLNAKKDKNGHIEKISFESKLVAFSTKIRNNE